MIEPIGRAGVAGQTALSGSQDAVSTGDAPPREAAGPVETTAASASGRRADLDFEPSSNLSEVSDWLTKLLLGAGLVSLTKLGHPLGMLIDTVARGLENSATGVTGPARMIAGAVILTYTTLGFLDCFVVTTLWYGKRIRAA